MNKKSLAFILVVATVVPAHADTLAFWSFNDATTGSGGSLGTVPTSTALIGTGTWTTNAGSGTVSGAPAGVGSFGGTTVNAPNGTVAGQALTIQGGYTSGATLNNGRYIQFETSTSGYAGLKFSYATRGTSTGFTDQKVSYSTDGTNFTTFTTLTGRRDTAWTRQEINLSDIATLNNQGRVIVRLTLSGASNQSGNNRFDNVLFEATAAPVPEPATMAVLGLGALVAVRRRNVRK